MAALKTFDMKNNFLFLGTHRVKGFMPGSSGISWEPDEVSWRKLVGSDGQVSRAGTGVTSGKFTVSIQMTADTNNFFTALRNTDIATGGSGILPLTLKDGNGFTLITAESGYIEGPPSAEWGDEISGRDWVIEHGEAIVVLGGSL